MADVRHELVATIKTGPFRSYARKVLNISALNVNCKFLKDDGEILIAFQILRNQKLKALLISMPGTLEFRINQAYDLICNGIVPEFKPNTLFNNSESRITNGHGQGVTLGRGRSLFLLARDTSMFRRGRGGRNFHPYNRQSNNRHFNNNNLTPEQLYRRRSEQD